MTRPQVFTLRGLVPHDGQQYPIEAKVAWFSTLAGMLSAVGAPKAGSATIEEVGIWAAMMLGKLPPPDQQNLGSMSVVAVANSAVRLGYLDGDELKAVFLMIFG